VAFVEHKDESRHSRRIEPMARSAKGFCQGARGAMTPRASGLVGDADVEEFSAIVVEDHEAEEEAKRQGKVRRRSR